MSEVAERLAKRRTDMDSPPHVSRPDARWWMLAIADELGEVVSDTIATNPQVAMRFMDVAQWLREQAGEE